MIPWIQVYSNLPKHPKTSRLADELGLTSAAFNPNTLAVGLLVCLWTWAIQNATGGDLSSCSPRAIAEACQWKKKPEILIKALIKSGYMDADMKLHDWDDYTAMYQDLQDDTKEKHRDRQKRYRERQKKASVTVTRDACVTSHGDGCDAIPYLTRPNLALEMTDMFRQRDVEERPKMVITWVKKLKAFPCGTCRKMDAYYLACKEHEEQIPPEIYQGMKPCKARVPEK